MYRWFVCCYQFDALGGNKAVGLIISSSCLALMSVSYVSTIACLKLHGSQRSTITIHVTNYRNQLASTCQQFLYRRLQTLSLSYIIRTDCESLLEGGMSLNWVFNYRSATVRSIYSIVLSISLEDFSSASLDHSTRVI